MVENVFVFGAGVSARAKIPMLKEFVQVMWEIAIRGRIGNKQLSKSDTEIFKNAIKVRDELDKYHGRAQFDDRNIEDILSILAFNLYENRPSDKKMMAWVLKAIERTIDLCCEVEFDERNSSIQESGNEMYRNFWILLLKWKTDGNQMPSIITFNYDLVVERSLFQVLNNYRYNKEDIFKGYGICLNYYFKGAERLRYKTVPQTYYDNERGYSGSRLMRCGNEIQDLIPIDILKMHGSLNFSKNKKEYCHATVSSNMPIIVPPVFNKSTQVDMNPIWKRALECFRNAKNIIFIGYSLPQTDIYMQYFIKAGLGPNNNLNKIFVFDPVFSKQGNQAESMKSRFKKCFSSQIYSRISFVPDMPINGSQKGTFAHFVKELEINPCEYLF